MTNNIFQDIIDKKIPANIVYEDDLAIAFNDISPQAPIHILVIPKKSIPKLADSNSDDKDLLGHLLLVVKKITAEQKINDYRVVSIMALKLGKQYFIFIYIY